VWKGQTSPIFILVNAELNTRETQTSLLNVFTRGFFTQIYEPTVFENYVHDLTVDDQVVELSLWDTAGETFWSRPISLYTLYAKIILLKGQEEFDRLRSLSYAETHVIMLCFSVRIPQCTRRRADGG